MKPVTQDIFINDPRGRPGNCLQAAIASICEKELQEVPHFVEHDDWFAYMCNWLYEQGYDIEDVENVEDCQGIALVFGPSPRGAAHAVLYQDGKLLHDPHPSRDGILSVEWIAEIYKRVNEPVPEANELP